MNVLDLLLVVKRNMSKATFDSKKIVIAIKKGFDSVNIENTKYNENDIFKVYNCVLKEIEDMKDAEFQEKTKKIEDKKAYENIELKIKVEEIQDIIENKLKELGYVDVYEKFSCYRENMKKRREAFEDRKEYKFLKILENIKKSKAQLSAKNKIMDYGREITKQLAITTCLKRKHEQLHTLGEIHIHGLEYLYLGLSAFTQIDLTKVFNNGYFTLSGEVSKVNGITAMSHVCSNILQFVSREQYYGESIPAFDKFLSDGVLYSFKKIFKQLLFDILQVEGIYNFLPINGVEREIEKISRLNFDIKIFNKYLRGSKEIEQIFKKVYILSLKRIKIETKKSMDAFLHNLNTQVVIENEYIPNYTINLGTDISDMGQLVIESLFKAIDDGLANKLKPRFPEIVFKVKKGINLDKKDPNYYLFEWAQKLKIDKIYFSNLDSIENSKFLKENDFSSEVAYLDGIRTIENVIDKKREISFSRGLLFNTSINLVRLSLKYGLKTNDVFKKKEFFEELDQLLQDVKSELNSRFILASDQKPNDFIFLYKQNLWIDSDKIKDEDKLRRTIKNGIIGISIMGGYEAILALCEKVDKNSQRLLEEIIKFIFKKCEEFSQELCLNIQLMGLNENMSKNIFKDLDAAIYGKISDITNKENYTYSISLPKKFKLDERIEWESKFTKYLKAGSYIKISKRELKENMTSLSELFNKKKFENINLIKLEEN